MSKIKQLQDMGFTEAVAKKAIAECNWDVNKALDLLFSRGGVLEDDPPVDNHASPSEVEAHDPPAAMAPKTVPGRGPSDYADTSTAASDSSSSGTGGQEPEAAPAEAAGDGKGAAHTPEACEPSAVPAGTSQDINKGRRIERAGLAWHGENARTELLVDEGDFVSLWFNTLTQHGWIFAEKLGSDASGWLPYTVLSKCPDTTVWMRCTRSKQAEPAHKTTMDIAEGEIIRVQYRTRVPAGWVFAEKPSGTAPQCSMLSGWVPVDCLDWTED